MKPDCCIKHCLDLCNQIGDITWWKIKAQGMKCTKKAYSGKMISKSWILCNYQEHAAMTGTNSLADLFLLPWYLEHVFHHCDHFSGWHALQQLTLLRVHVSTGFTNALLCPSMIAMVFNGRLAPSVFFSPSKWSLMKTNDLTSVQKSWSALQLTFDFWPALLLASGIAVEVLLVLFTLFS